jgi:hypothetical protein
MRTLIEAELARSQTIIVAGTELVPRFSMQTEDGEVVLFVQLPDDIEARQRRMELVRDYMAVKMVRSFVLSTELMQPDASVAMGVERAGCEAGLQLIGRSPLAFSATQWLGPENIGDEVVALLPGRVAEVTPEQVRAVEELIRHNDGMTLER